MRNFFIVLLSIIGLINASEINDNMNPKHKECCAKAYNSDAEQKDCYTRLRNQLVGSHIEDIFEDELENQSISEVIDDLSDLYDEACNIVVTYKQKRNLKPVQFGFLVVAGLFAPKDKVNPQKFYDKFLKYYSTENDLNSVLPTGSSWWQFLLDKDDDFLLELKNEKHRAILADKKFRDMYIKYYYYAVENNLKKCYIGTVMDRYVRDKDVFDNASNRDMEKYFSVKFNGC